MKKSKKNSRVLLIACSFGRFCYGASAQSLERLRPWPQIQLMHPAIARLAMDLPVGISDVVWIENTVLILELVQLRKGVADKRGIDGPVDNRVGDMNALVAEFAGHALGQRA